MKITDQLMENYTPKGTIIAVCISGKKSVRKKNVGAGVLIENFGLENDAHGNKETHRQISLLALESIRKMQEMGLNVGAGDFAENLTTEGINLLGLPLGTKVRIGDKAILEITQHGKECHTPCAIYHQAGMCIMPLEGIFAKVLQSGSVQTGDEVTVLGS